MSVRIVTDSTCDLPAETIAKYGIGVVPLYINVGQQGFLDGIDMTRAEFYPEPAHLSGSSHYGGTVAAQISRDV